MPQNFFREVINGFLNGERETTIVKIQHKIIFAAVDDFSEKVKTLADGHRKNKRRLEKENVHVVDHGSIYKSSRLDNVEILDAEIVEPRRKIG